MSIETTRSRARTKEAPRIQCRTNLSSHIVFESISSITPISSITGRALGGRGSRRSQMPFLHQHTLNGNNLSSTIKTKSQTRFERFIKVRSSHEWSMNPHESIMETCPHPRRSVPCTDKMEGQRKRTRVENTMHPFISQDVSARSREECVNE